MRNTPWDLTEIERRMANIVRLGTVAAVDTATALATVTMGEVTTTWLPWITRSAGAAITGWSPTVGEQVMVLSPSGDLGQGVILPSLYSDAHPAPSGYSDRAEVTQYDDGAVVAYDPESHELAATLPSGGKAKLTAPAGVEITGDTTITGKLHITEKVTADADIDCAATVTADTDCVGGGISLKNHKHTGVSSGSSVSGKPQA